MQSIRQLIDSITARFTGMSSSDIPDLSSRRIWVNDEEFGPDDWYLSRAEMYKAIGGVKHERFVATMRQTSRHAKSSTPTPHSEISIEDRLVQADDTKILVIERTMDRKAATEGSGFGADALEILRQIKDVDSDSIKSALCASEFIIKLSLGAHPACDKVSLLQEPCEGFELLGRIDFPPPPVILPHEDDFDAVFKELSEQDVSDETHTSPPRTCTFISLMTLISLAYSIGQERSQYTSMLFFALRRYTSSKIIIPVVQNPDIVIKPDDSVNTIKKAFEKAKLDPGHYSVLEIMAIPKDDEIKEVLERWRPEREKLDKVLRTERLVYIETERKRLEKVRQEELEEGEKRAEKARQEGIEEGEKRAEKARQEGIEEGEKRVERAMKKVQDEQRQQLLAMGLTEEKISSVFRDIK
ncbi:hypothetical protein Agabi119p4_6844 [Agaricus bisporus var. burnettii]|uniref:Uncharacterized protein n=1 Tax=Agaricus bisporus var. burnettii TaxID=192524 RepID=A0A8H7KF69_AGABI|nr:hypothetical protein Agabi119p4_6844 [Agaricus bisporus var. burnettii]